MEENDRVTITIKRAPNGTFSKIIEQDWLRYLGFTEREIENAPEIKLVVKADWAEHKKVPFIGIGKAEQK